MDASTLAMLLFALAFVIFGLLSIPSAAQYIPPQTMLQRTEPYPWYEDAVNLAPIIALFGTLKLADASIPGSHPWLFSQIEIATLCLVIPLYLRYSTVARNWRTRAR